jgi:hypothetical protein
MWALGLRGGEPDAAFVDDVSDASEVDSWLVSNLIITTVKLA